MKKLKFEYRITILYVFVGGLWIIGSDWILEYLLVSNETISRFQTYKGWFYVFVTAVLFFIFLQRHLQHLRITERELEDHKNNLELLVSEKVKDLKNINDELFVKNEIINDKNSELKSTIKNLKETQSQLIQAEKMASLGTLISGVSHEINNPLNYIMGAYVGLNSYFEEFGSSDEKNTEFMLESLNEGIERASDIVKGLNQFSQDNSENDANCDIHSILDNCLIILQNMTSGKKKVIKNYFDKKVIVKGNLGQLHQAFLNIILNSVQAIEGKENGEIIIVTEEIDKNIRILISDNGYGVSEENISQMINPFFTTRPPGQGVGLGLSITYSIIKEHGGSMEFKSEVSKGTQVCVSLPKIKNNDESE